MQEIAPDRAVAVMKGADNLAVQTDSHTYIPEETENTYTYIHTVTRNNNNNNVKVLRSWKVNVDLASSLKLYAVQSRKDASLIVELAVSEYMVNHPVTIQPSYSVVVENTVVKQTEAKAEPEVKDHCQIGECDYPSVGLMYFQLDKELPVKEYRVCKIHQKKLSLTKGNFWRFTR